MKYGPTSLRRISANAVRHYPALGVLAAALYLTSQWLNSVFLNDDIAWLFILGQRMLDGARAYIDFVEINPPASILIYMPALLMGHWLHLPPENVLLVLLIGGVLISLYVTGKIAVSASLIRVNEEPWLAALVLALLLILPAYSFGQREHISLIAMMPMLAVYAARMNAKKVNTASAFGCGIGGGVAVCIKPYFALALLLPLMFALWRSRASAHTILRLLFSSENIAAALVSVVYLASIFLYFPAFIRDGLPFALAVYVPLKLPFWAMLTSGGMILLVATAVLTVALGARQLGQPLIAVVMLAACGFSLSFLIQDKGYSYQSYPAIALVMFAAGILALREIPRLLSATGGPSRKIRTTIASAVAALYAGLFLTQTITLFNFQFDMSRVAAAIQRLALPRPRIIAISERLPIGIVTTHEVGGVWVGRACCFWTGVTDRLLRYPNQSRYAHARLLYYDRFSENLIADDIRTGRPDIVLIEVKPDKTSAFSHPKIAEQLRMYRAAETVDGIEIWVRRDRTVRVQ